MLFSIISKDLRRAGLKATKTSGSPDDAGVDDVGVVSLTSKVRAAIRRCAHSVRSIRKCTHSPFPSTLQALRESGGAGGDGDENGDGDDDDTGKAAGNNDEGSDDDDDDEVAGGDDGNVRVGLRKEVDGYEEDNADDNDDDSDEAGNANAGSDSDDAAVALADGKAKAGSGKKARKSKVVHTDGSEVIRVQVPDSVMKNPLFSECVYSMEDAWVEVALHFPPSSRKVRRFPHSRGRVLNSGIGACRVCHLALMGGVTRF